MPSEEEIILETKPVALSFLPFYLPGAYLFGVTIYFLLRKDSFLELLPTPFDAQARLLMFYLFLSFVLLLPALIYSFVKLNLRWLVSYSVALLLSFVIKHEIMGVSFEPRQTDWIEDNAELFSLLVISALSLINAEIFRQSHRYLITNARIHTQAGIFAKRERTLLLSKINDFSATTSLLGRLFGFGSLIPITASGMGMGSNFASVQAGAGQKWGWAPELTLGIEAGHSIQVPKSRTHEALIGIKNMDVLREKLLRILAQRELSLND